MSTTTAAIPADPSTLSVRELMALLAQLGHPVTSRNKPYLLRKLAAARPAPAEAPAPAPEATPRPARPRPATSARAAAPGPRKAKDKRLPKIGEWLEREHGGKKHRVQVLAGGRFLYRGKEYSSLSTIAKKITGTVWNGFLFFHLTPYPKHKNNPTAA